MGEGARPSGEPAGWFELNKRPPGRRAWWQRASPMSAASTESGAAAVLAFSGQHLPGHIDGPKRPEC